VTVGWLSVVSKDKRRNGCLGENIFREVWSEAPVFLLRPFKNFFMNLKEIL